MIPGELSNHEEGHCQDCSCTNHFNRVCRGRDDEEESTTDVGSRLRCLAVSVSCALLCHEIAVLWKLNDVCLSVCSVVKRSWRVVMMIMMMGKVVRWRVPAVDQGTQRRLVQFRGYSWSPLVTSVAIGAIHRARAAAVRQRCSNCCLFECVDRNNSSTLPWR